jgi:protocatechuate 3,4-dioxygenase beta subunit
MPWKRGFIFSILFSALCLSQQIKSDTQSQKTASISGTVFQAGAQAPLKNVEVTIVHHVSDESGSDDDSPATPELTMKSDDKGHYEFSKLAPGPYYVRASRAGLALKGHHWQEGVFIDLEAGKNQTLDLTMMPTAVIAGQVVNEDGEPMQHVSLAAMRYGYTVMGRHLAQAATASTDDKGQFRLFGLQPGSYLVVASPSEGAFEGGMVVAESTESAAPSKKDQTVYTTVYYPNEKSPERATPILVKPGDETQANFTMTRVPAHSVSGTVAGLPAAKADDKPEMSYRMVMAMREGSFFPASMGMVGKDSSFKIRSLPAGKYKLVAMQGGGGINSSGSADVVVESSDVTGVVIGAQAGPREIKGRIRAEGEDKPDLSKLFVVFTPAADPETDLDMDSMASSFFGGGGGFAQIKEDGSFKVELTPSAKPYTIAVSSRGGGMEDWFTSKILVGGKDVLETGFKPAEGQAGAVEIVVSNKGATIEGTVLDKNEKPFPGADVIAFPADPKLRKRMDMVQAGTADQQGRFKLRGVRPGEYTVFALADSQEQPFTTAAFQKTNSGKMQTVKLEAGNKQQVQLEVITQGP